MVRYAINIIYRKKRWKMSLKIKNKNLIKIVLDIILSALLVLMFNKNVISLNFHEIGGLFLGGFILIHNLLNWKWIVAVSKKIFSKDLAFKLRLGYILNFLLLITMALIIVSGIFISKTLFTGISLHGGNWKIIHYAAAALSLILVGIHIGLHWGFIIGMFKKYIKIPTAIAKPISIILVIAVVLFGSYSMFTSNFRMWITAPFTSTQMEGGQRPMNFDLQTDVDDSTKPNGDKAFGKGERPSGEGLPQKGDRTFLGGGEHGGSSSVLSVILTFTSIMGVFATITYYCEKLIKRRKKPSQAIIQN